MGKWKLHTYSAALEHVQDKANVESVSSPATEEATWASSRSLSFALLSSSRSVCCLMRYGTDVTATIQSLTAGKAH